MSTVPDNTAPKQLAPIPEVTMSDLQKLLAKVTSNPATLEFPTDKWGFTSAIKKEVLKSASQVYGQDDKHDLLVSTLAVLMKHIQVRKESDRKVREQRFAEQEAVRAERLPRERISAPAVPAPVTYE